jgi:biotin carboxyl carrier protein
VPDAGPQRKRSNDADRADAGRATAERGDAGRRADHAGIARLTDGLLPALIAKLGSTQLGELEVREGDWQVRLRRPFGSAPGEGRRVTDKPSRAQPGHEGHGHARAAPEGHRPGRTGAGAGAGPTGTTAGTGAAAAGQSTNGTGGGRSPGSRESGDRSGDHSRTIATSPGVGIFEPGTRAAAGTRVRAGDTLGAVNVLGVPQEIAAPVDGIVGATLVEKGMAVEYGQELIRIELTAPAEAR